MKKYFAVALAGLLFLLPILTASAEEPVRILVAEQSVGTSAPVEATVQFDPAPRPMAADNGADQLWGGHFVAGAGVYIIRPYFQNNPAYFTETFASAGVSVFTFETAQHDFSWGLNAAPVVWLGYVSECGARWWLFDQRSATSAMSDPNTIVFSAEPGGLSIETPTGLPFSAVEPGSRMFVSSNLKLNVWDFEGTWETAAGRWGLLFSGGVRYAHLSQDYNAFQTSRGATFGIFIPGEEFLLTDLLSSGHNFNGAGPTLALEAKRPIGNSGLSLFANLRGAMLFGQSKQQVDQPTIIERGFPNPTTSVSVTSFSYVRDTLLPVAELEMGVEFSRNWGAARPFLRTGLVAQTWFDAGSASQLDGNLGFLGLSVMAGLNY